jgi:hypothetical protein
LADGFIQMEYFQELKDFLIMQVHNIMAHGCID